MRIACLGCLALLLTAPAWAAGPAPDPDDPGCACVANGKRFAQGEVACVLGQRMQCGMVQNVTSWSRLNESCQVSAAFPGQSLLPL